MLDGTAVLVALPAIGRDLGLGAESVQWVVTAYVLVFAGCLLVAGRLADALGRRRVFLAGMALFTGASLACGLAPGPRALVLARALQGLGAALTAPAALAMIIEGFRGGRAVAVWTAVAAVGGAAGLVLGGVIAGAFGWRWVFLVNVPIGLATLALAPRVLAESRDRAGRLDLPGALAATAGLALLVFGLAPSQPAALAGAVLVLALLVVRERTAAEPLVPPALLRARRLNATLLAAVLLTATTSGGAVLATLHLQDALGLGPVQAGLVLLPFSLAVVAGSAVAARLSAGVPAVAAGVALVGAGSAVAAVLLSVPGVVAWGVLCGGGLGAASVAATTLGAAAVDGHRGTVAGLQNTAAQVGTAVGIAALVLVAGAAGLRYGFAAAAAAAALAAPALKRAL